MPAQRRVVARFGEGDVRRVIEDPETLKVLYDPLRFKVVGLLRDGRTAKELAEDLGRPLTSLYYHLNVLVEHGLVVVGEERIKGRAVERVFRRAADEFVADGQVAEVVDGLVDRDERLASGVEHLRRIYRGKGSSDGTPVMVMDVTFAATDEDVRALIERLRETVKTTVPKSRRAGRGAAGATFRLLVTLGQTEEESGAPARRKPGRR